MFASARNGRTLLLGTTGRRDGAKAFAGKYLADADDWKMYQGLTSSVAVPFDELNPATQREVLLAVFPYDVVTVRGWTHYVLHEGDSSQETLWTLCTWLTGKGGTYKEVMAVNTLETDKLSRGQSLFFPENLLRDVMKQPTGERPAPPDSLAAPPLMPAEEPADTPLHALATGPAPGPGELEYGSDAHGAFALYRLKQGEALYTDVVARFTDVDVLESAAASILASCRVVMDRSGIRDERSIPVGTAIKIPMEMLTAQYMPEGSSERTEYQAMVLEAQRLRGAVRSKDLAGVVVIPIRAMAAAITRLTTNARFSLTRTRSITTLPAASSRSGSDHAATVYLTVTTAPRGMPRQTARALCTTPMRNC